MTSREQFEAWFNPKKAEMQAKGVGSLNIVMSSRTAWAAWQASREALKPVAWAHRLVNKHSGVAHPWVYGSAEKVCSEGDVFRVEVRSLYSNEEY